MLYQHRCIINLTLAFLFFLSGVSYAQNAKVITPDTVIVKKGFVERMQDFAKKSELESAEDLRWDKAELVQESLLIEIKKNLQKAKLYLKAGLDTTLAKQELNVVSAHAKLVGDGIFAHKEPIQTYRNLVTTEKILKVLLYRCNQQKIKLDHYKKQLSGFKYQMDSLSSVKEIFAFPKDSVKLSKYMQTLLITAKEVAPIDSLIDASVLRIQTLQNQANLQVFSLENSLDEIAIYQSKMADQLFKKELPFIWAPTNTINSFGQTLSYSYHKDKLNLSFYSKSNLGLIALCLVLLGVCYGFILSLKKAFDKNAVNDDQLVEDNLVLRYPFASAIFLVANLSQFIFNSPPFIFSLFFWLTAAVSLTVLLKGYISKFWMKTWLVLLLLLVFAAIDNLILQPSGAERWYMLILALTGIVTGTLIFIKGKRAELREQLILYAIGLMILLEFSSLCFNIFGSYNLAKAFLVAGYVNVIVAIMFLWTIRLINQGLQLAVSLFAKQDRSLFFMNFDRVGKSAPMLLYILLVVGWLILFGRNFPAYVSIVEPVRDFFFDQRSIGSYDFSISSLILFFFVVAMAVIVSKIVSFFALDKRTFSKQPDGKRGLGSWVLLIRIAIIILGFFLAFASVGIPIDKIAIVLGALGVGIGFGLQSLVNNLVSGLVIAFEKPLNLDDEVEIAGKTGTVKSIGFRSSVITTYDGAEVVLPNGDLLNSHLINWSSGTGRRRTAIVFNISRGADLTMIREGILNILLADDRILKHPEASVFFQDMNSDTLELHCYYWTRQTKILATIKNDVLVAINQFFVLNEIKLPYPKQEVFVHPSKEKN